MTVYLVGAGPGDPGLLTVRGAEVLGGADVVVHDRLSVASLLELAPPAAERIGVGKTPRGPSTPQEEINRLLVVKGRAGLEVVRLKGGDPFVFARGAEEAAALAAAGVAFEVVPGVTSAVAVPAYAGVPVTARGLATSFTVVTGHGDGLGATPTDWEAVARVGGTIVVLMGVATRSEIARRLLSGGLAPTTPVVSVRWGARPEQRTVRTTLGALAGADLESPAVIVIGEVAALDLAWYERLPLFGRAVVVTRPRHQAEALTRRLRRLGAATIPLPTIEVGDPADGGVALRAAAGSVSSYDWVVFTSANAVERFVPLLRDARAFGAARVAAIGPGTAEALAEANVVADLVPERFVAEALLEVFPPPPSCPGRGRVLLPRAAVARDVLPEGLRAAGWQVDVVEAYRTSAARPSPEALADLAAADAIAFTSSSTVTSFVEVAGARAVPPVVVCIGPVTAATARQLGISVDAEADVHTLDGLVDALVTALAT
ncbi:MAG: uroporphyrinogen-III C-methyltransferase [Actinobacteria bacterium]|nr:uroporphyrinogen-III C-methyltransferase [Actinomycetota bacterium]MBW3642179.1 uroporphyrinogen-III C-methyltransferase [Actinomycetota bacterium]